jgi:2-polyprenyl-3-methyl-5-hydroxy-6-metoxy-1,4-benzoquinol methylase
MLRLRPAPEMYDERFMDTMANAYLEQTPWTELRLAAVRDLVDPHPDDRILDIGCAAGAITHYLSTFGADAIGIDSRTACNREGSRALPRTSVRARGRD